MGHRHENRDRDRDRPETRDQRPETRIQIRYGTRTII